MQQKIIADFEAGKLAWDARQAELNKEVPVIMESFFNLFSFPRLRREGRRIHGCRRGRKGGGYFLNCHLMRLLQA